MKKKFISVLIFFLIFLCFAFTSLIKPLKPQKHKVLKVIRADLFYADMNDNSKIDKDELFKLTDIYAFSPELNPFSKQKAQDLRLNIDEYLKCGYLAQNWANDNLLGHYVVITSLTRDKTKEYDYITAKIGDQDLSKFYLENGLAFSKTDGPENSYHNIQQVKSNADVLSKLDFVLLNLNSNVLHKLNCEHIASMFKGKLILFKNAKNYLPCKSCFENKQNQIPAAQKPPLYSSFDGIQLYNTNPIDYKKPDNSCSNNVCKRLLKEIDNTKHTLDIALYGIGDINGLYNALINAKNRGVKIRMIFDYSPKMYELYPETAQFIKEFSSKSDKSDVIMHNKFFIFDNKKIMSGSANISPSGIGGYSSNSIVFIDSEVIAKRYKQEFDEMYSGRFSVFKNKFELVSDKNITPYFSPKDDIKSMIISKINTAKEEICVSAFFLTQKDVINALISAKNRNVKVYIILDAVSANNFKDRVGLLRKSGIMLIVENWGGKNHEKTILIDKKILILGSANFSYAGFNKNDENMLLIENSNIAKQYRDYFFYLFNSIDKKFLKFTPRAEGTDSVNSCSDGIDNNFDGKIDSNDVGCQ